MTILNLMNKSQDSAYRTAAKAAYSKTSQVVEQMSSANGENFVDYMSSEDSFRPLFMSYFKVIKDCVVDSCDIPSHLTLTGETPSTGCFHCSRCKWLRRA
jgi:hypothetical protein